MKPIFLKFIFSFSLLFHAYFCFAADDILILEEGVAAHEGIDTLYYEFAKAYEMLDANHFKSIYSRKTYYLAPKSPMYFSNSEVADKGFANWFDYVKQEGGRLSVAFNIIAREVSGHLAYDVGYIKSIQKLPGKDDEIYQSKILVVSKKQDDGKWQFKADTYSHLK